MLVRGGSFALLLLAVLVVNNGVSDTTINESSLLENEDSHYNKSDKNDKHKIRQLEGVAFPVVVVIGAIGTLLFPALFPRYKFNYEMSLQNDLLNPCLLYTSDAADE